MQCEKEEKRRYSEMEKTNTQFNMVSSIKQIVCTPMRERRETLLNFGV